MAMPTIEVPELKLNDYYITVNNTISQDVIVTITEKNALHSTTEVIKQNSTQKVPVDNSFALSVALITQPDKPFLHYPNLKPFTTFTFKPKHLEQCTKL